MPVSAPQYRTLTGAYQNNLHKKFSRNSPQARSINPDNSSIPADVHNFGRNISLVVNSPKKMINRPSDQRIAATLLLLFSQLRFSDGQHSATPDSLFTESEGAITPPVTAKVDPSGDSTNGFSALWNPVANSVYRMGEYISKHDPLRFPTAAAVPIRRRHKGRYFTDNRVLRYAVFQKKTTTPPPVTDEVGIKQLVLSCVEERQDLSIADVLRQIGKTLSNPVSELAKESQVIHYYNNYGRCPTKEEILNLYSITSLVDQVISQIMNLIPHGRAFVVTQRVGGSLFRMIADSIDQKQLNLDDLNEAHQGILDLAKTISMSVIKANNGKLIDSELSIPNHLSIKNNKITIEINGKERALINKNNNLYVNYKGKNQIVSYSSEDKTWFREVKGRARAVTKCFLRIKRSDDNVAGSPGLVGGGDENATLDKYRLPLRGLFNREHFIQDWRANNAIPDWASKFLKGNKRVLKPEKISSRKGALIASGRNGAVYQDYKNPHFVIKSIKIRDVTSEIDMDMAKTDIEREIMAFQKVYGKSAANYHIDKISGFTYIRMYRIPGVQLSEIRKETLPRNAVALFEDMMRSLSERNIVTSDLSEANIMWDAQSNRFFPIDIELPANESHRKVFIEREQKRLPEIKEKIARKVIKC